MNLFIELHETRFGGSERRFGTGWEDLFTEQLAFFLSADLAAAGALARLFLGREVGVTVISTQQWLADGTPDLHFELTDTGHFHVEHKFDSPLGERQLQRYLQHGRVALVSRRSQSVPDEVLASPNYLRPPDRPYFDWADVYGALAAMPAPPAGFGALRTCFLGYMRDLGLAPLTNPEWRALFAERTVPENQRVQKEFGRRLDPVKHGLRDRGLRLSDVSHKGRAGFAPPGSVWLYLYVGPGLIRADYMDDDDARAFDPGYEALVVEMTFEPNCESNARAVHRAVQDGFRDSEGRRWYAAKPRIQVNKRIRISLATSLGGIMSGGSIQSDSMCKSALEVIDLLLQAASATVTGSSATLEASSGGAVPNSDL
jgi:hypothetical protein